MTKTIINLFATLLLLLILISFLLLNSFKPIKQDNNQQWIPSAHLQIILEETDPNFNKLFLAGAQEAANNNNAFLEIVPINRWGDSSLTKLVEIGCYSKVDSIGIQTNDFKLTEDLYNLTEAQGVKLVVYESENHLIQSPLPLIGSNTYSIGITAGNLALKSIVNTNIPTKIVLILEKSEEAGYTQYPSMKYQGLLESLEPYKNVSISNVYTLGPEPFAAEKLLDTMLDDYEDFDMIISLSNRATPLLAQRIIDHNLVGQIKVIGYGSQPQTLDYINRGVIFGVISPDSYDIGYNTIKQMITGLKGEMVNDYLATELKTITTENLDEFYLDPEIAPATSQTGG